MISAVFSTAIENHSAHDIAYEWAEEFARYFHVKAERKIFHVSSKIIPRTWLRIKVFINKILPIARELRRAAKNISDPALTQDINSPLSVWFIMEVPHSSACAGSNCLLIYTDVWTDTDIKYIVKRTKNFKLFYVTSRNIFERIKAEDPNSNVHYMPLSVPDKYFSPNFAKYRDKTIDVIQFGRKNSVLHSYMMQYANEHKYIDYVYSHDTPNSQRTYISTIRGNIGSFTTHEDFSRILSSAKVSLVSSPGVDIQRSRTVGVSFPTPRFYESAILGCALIGRYPDNEEFRELNMNRYCPNITSYEQFAECLERALAQTPEELYAQNHDFIINSLTSKRAEQIQRDLAELTEE